MARVSIIVRTVAGRELLLARAVESIATQISGRHSIETIVAVDGPPIDQERARIGRGRNVSVVTVGQSGGRSAAANVGLEAATGDLLGFLDDDDWLEPNHVSVLAGLLETHPTAAAAYGAAWQQEARIDLEDPSMSVIGERTVFYRPIKSSLDLLSKNLFPIQAVLFRRIALEKSEARFATELDALEDWLFWQQLLLGERIVSTEQVTSTFLMPLDKALQERRAEAHRDAMPTMLALRQSIRVPIQVAGAVRARTSSSLRHGRGKSPATVRSFLAARLEMLKRKRPRLRHEFEYFLLRALRKLWRSTPRGRAEWARFRARSPKQGSGNAHRPQTNPAASALPSGTLQSRFQASGTWHRTADVAVFTSCNWAYMDKAAVLAESVARLMPGVEFHILLVDTPRPDRPLPPSVTRIFPAANLEDFKPAWVFRHTVVELSTAVKPLYTEVLLNEGFRRVVYFDPDTMLLSEPWSIDRDLERGDFLLTPHLHRPAVSRRATERFEISAMAHGIYNLGFFALNNTPAARAVISYWAERCRHYSLGEVHRGIFTDQKWANHFPVFFESTVVVSSNPGLNTAVWNAEGLTIIRRNDIFYIGGFPIEMFHFSGWDAGIPDRFSLEFLGEGSGTELVSMYAEANRRFAYLQDRFWPYAYYDDGSEIEIPHRLAYRRDGALQERFLDPYASGSGTFQDYAARNRKSIYARHDESKLIRRHF